MRTLIILLILVFTISCENIFDFDVVGNGYIDVYNPPLESNFSTIILNSNFDLEIIQSSKDSLSIQAESNLHPFIDITLLKDILIIGTNDNKELIPQYKIKLTLFVENISQIENPGKGRITLDTLKTDHLTVKQNGAGYFTSNKCEIDSLYYLSEGTNVAHINGSFRSCFFQQIGSGDISISGNTSKLKAIQEGSGKISAYGLQSKSADIQMYGTGLIYCRVSDFMSVRVVGEGKVFYKGAPAITSDLAYPTSLISVKD